MQAEISLSVIAICLRDHTQIRLPIYNERSTTLSGLFDSSSERIPHHVTQLHIERTIVVIGAENG